MDDNCWQIEGLIASINSPCVCCGHLGECTIRLGYTPFLTTIVFRRVDSVWGPTSDIRVEVTSSNSRGVTGGEIVGRSKNWCESINSPCVRHGRLGECTISLRYALFITAIAFRRVGSAWGPTIINARIMIFAFNLPLVFIKVPIKNH